MKLKFITDCEACIVTNLDENEDPIEEIELFSKGCVIECDLIDYAERMIGGKLTPDKSLWNVQFGDGSMVFGLSREWFEIVEENT